MQRLDFAAAALVLAAALLGCSGGGEGGAPPVETIDFPSNYRTAYTLMKDCATSGEHDLNNVRVYASSTAVGPFRTRSAPFPKGAVVIKEEHDIGDTNCADDPIQWTVMKKLATGSSSEKLDWHWQLIDASRHIVNEDAARCWGCHALCGVEPDGFDGTCTMLQ
ncbi:MAG TPA: cytochrome P460 family protein [Polyangiaceae bacterium]|nr:cytochrome P460 family protein [Polyangiaceae bacterium]